MALIKICDNCGAKISLRKMPHGRFVAFEFQTQTPHKCGARGKPKKQTRRKSSQSVQLKLHQVDSDPKKGGRRAKQSKKWERKAAAELEDMLRKEKSAADEAKRQSTTSVSDQDRKPFIQDDMVVKVLEVIKNRPGLKAREIAEQLGLDRNQVNAILFGPLSELVGQDSHFGWRVKQGQSLGAPEQAPSQRFKADQGDEINWLKWIGYAVGAFILYKIFTG